MLTYIIFIIVFLFSLFVLKRKFMAALGAASGVFGAAEVAELIVGFFSENTVVTNLIVVLVACAVCALFVLAVRNGK